MHWCKSSLRPGCGASCFGHHIALPRRLAKIAGKYAGRSPNTTAHHRIVALRAAGQTIKQTAELSGSSLSQVKRIWAMHLANARAAEG